MNKTTRGPTAEMIEQFRDLIYERSSLYFSASRRINLEARLRERTLAMGKPYEDYYELLKGDDEELERLIDDITTKETYFYRLPGQFRFLRETVLPAIEDRLSEESTKRLCKVGPDFYKPPINIWSAGCATGEEPYSIAMEMLNSLKYPRAWDIDILATDISRRALARAASGVFDGRRLSKLPPGWLERFFAKTGEGYRVTDNVRSKVSFGFYNLARLNESSCLPQFLDMVDTGRRCVDMKERFDLVFCRNVMIYFDIPAQQRLVDRLSECLKPGGYLFTGDAESLQIHKHDFEAVNMHGSCVYRKSEQ